MRMNLDMKLHITFFTSSLFLLTGVSCYYDFEITVPSHEQVGVYGESMILSCTFPMRGSWDEESTVITWQRHREVVHSFYHGRDQMQHQSRRYTDRTSLFYEEMKKGNASLRLDRVTLDDAGEYTCSVSTQVGSQKKSFRLRVAAYYPEPHLHISLLNNGHVEVLVTSEGGYPSPSLQWLMGSASDITNDTDTQLWRDENTQLYRVNSKLNLTGSVHSSITFILKNQELGQEIRRNISLISENRGPEDKPQTLIIGLSVALGVTYLIGLIIFCINIYWIRKKKIQNPEGMSNLRPSEVLSPASNGQTKVPLKTERENLIVHLSGA